MRNAPGGGTRQLRVFLETLENGLWSLLAERNREVYVVDGNTEVVSLVAPFFESLSSTLCSLFGYNRCPVIESTRVFPIRGLPGDISLELQNELPDTDTAIGFSWLTVKELRDFPWDTSVRIRMIVADRYEQMYLGLGEDGTTSRMHSDRFPTLRHIDLSTTCAKASGPDFMRQVTNALVREFGPSEKARIVYWFEE